MITELGFEEEEEGFDDDNKDDFSSFLDSMPLLFLILFSLLMVKDCAEEGGIKLDVDGFEDSIGFGI